SSQSGINQQGLIAETRGRTLAEQTQNAQNAASQLQANTASAKNNLLNQVAAAQNVGSPIAGSTIDDVNSALQTQRNADSGISSPAGDVASSFAAVPQVNTLSNIFAGILGSAGSLLGGVQANNVGRQVAAGLAGTSPSGSSTRVS